MISQYAPTMAYYKVYVCGLEMSVSVYFTRGMSYNLLRYAESVYSWNADRQLAICVKDRYTSPDKTNPLAARFFESLKNSADIVVDHPTALEYNEVEHEARRHYQSYLEMECRRLIQLVNEVESPFVYCPHNPLTDKTVSVSMRDL